MASRDIGLISHCIRLALVNGAGGVLRRRVHGEQFQGILSRVADVVPHPSGDSHDVARFEGLTAPVQDGFALARYDGQNLVDGVNFLADFFPPPPPP
jgi:hypothetical protein